MFREDDAWFEQEVESRAHKSDERSRPPRSYSPRHERRRKGHAVAGSQRRSRRAAGHC